VLGGDRNCGPSLWIHIQEQLSRQWLGCDPIYSAFGDTGLDCFGFVVCFWLSMGTSND
jgi:hypothetical protein